MGYDIFFKKAKKEGLSEKLSKMEELDKQCNVYYEESQIKKRNGEDNTDEWNKALALSNKYEKLNPYETIHYFRNAYALLTYFEWDGTQNNNEIPIEKIDEFIADASIVLNEHNDETSEAYIPDYGYDSAYYNDIMEAKDMFENFKKETSYNDYIVVMQVS